MKLKFLIFGLLFSAGLLFSLPAFAYTYQRTPAGYNTYNPVSFILNATTANELGLIPSSLSWKLGVRRYEPPFYIYITGCLATSTLSANETITLALEEYRYVQVLGWSASDCSGSGSDGITLEGAFEVGEAPPPTGGNIITMPAGFATSALAYAGQLFTDTSSLILIGIGLIIAFWIINKILVVSNVLEKVKIKKSEDFFSKHKSEKDDWL
jgi:hypothetical protein